jgi:hypothetical protein
MGDASCNLIKHVARDEFRYPSRYRKVRPVHGQICLWECEAQNTHVRLHINTIRDSTHLAELVKGNIPSHSHCKSIIKRA